MEMRRRPKPNVSDESIAEKATAWLEKDPVFLDTETTGLDATREVIEIGMVNHDGSVLMNQRIQPRESIDPGAVDVHGITMEDLADKPELPRVYDRIIDTLRDSVVIAYNVRFDWDSLLFHANQYDRTVPSECIEDRHCAMNLSAKWYGEWSPYHGSFTWQKLGVIAEALGLSEDDEFPGQHGALADARMTRTIIRELSNRS